MNSAALRFTRQTSAMMNVAVSTTDTPIAKSLSKDTNCSQYVNGIPVGYVCNPLFLNSSQIVRTSWKKNT